MFVVKKVSGKDFWYGGRNFEWLWCVVKDGTPVSDWDNYFDDEADAMKFANKLNAQTS